MLGRQRCFGNVPHFVATMSGLYLVTQLSIGLAEYSVSVIISAFCSSFVILMALENEQKGVPEISRIRTSKVTDNPDSTVPILI